MRFRFVHQSTRLAGGWALTQQHRLEPTPGAGSPCPDELSAKLGPRAASMAAIGFGFVSRRRSGGLRDGTHIGIVSRR